MKQMKFFLVALMAVVMGMSVTSCMNGDDNTQVNDLPVLGKVKDSFLGLLSLHWMDLLLNQRIRLKVQLTLCQVILLLQRVAMIQRWI